MEIEHCELEKWHYQALKSPLYVLDGMADVIREDLMMNAPLYPKEVLSERVTVSSRDDVEQLRRMVLYFQSKVMELRVSKKKGTSKYD